MFALTGSFRPERSTEPSTLRADIAEGVRYLYRHRLLRTFAFMVGMANLTYTAAFAVFPLFAVKPGPLGLSEFGFGLILTFFAAGSLIGSLVAARVERVLGRHRLLMLSVLLSGPPLALWATANIVVIAVTSVVSSIGIVMWNVVTVSLRQRVVPDRLLGRVNSAYRLLAWGTMPIGAALGGLLAEVVGIRTLFVVCGAANALMLLLSPFFTDAAMDEAERTKDLVATP